MQQTEKKQKINHKFLKKVASKQYDQPILHAMNKILRCLIFSCCFCPGYGQNHQQPFEIQISPVFDSAPLEAGRWYVSTNGDSIQLDQVRFYLSDIKVEWSNGLSVADPEKAHLVDIFEPESLIVVLPSAGNTTPKKIQFNLGIDSTTNVSGALGGDLDPTNGMYWSWQSGYINLKMEGISPKCNTRKHVFQYHIGGYLQPNRALRKIELHIDSSTQKEIFVKMDLATFFSNINFTTLSSVMTPGSNAMKLANYCTQMFSIHVPKK